MSPARRPSPAAASKRPRRRCRWTASIQPRRVTVNLVNAVVRLPEGGASTAPSTAPSTEPAGSSALHYVIGAGINALDDGTPLAPDDIALNEVTAEQLHAKVGDRV